MVGRSSRVLDDLDNLTAEHERRIRALEAHITDLEERLNARGIFSGDLAYFSGDVDYWKAVGQVMDKQRERLADA